MQRWSFVLALLLPQTATAQDTSLDNHGFQVVAGDGTTLAPLLSWKASPATHGVSMMVEYADIPLVFERADGSKDTLIDDLWVVNVGVRAPFHERVSLAIAAPLYLASRGSVAPGGPTAGDVRASMPVGILLPGADGGLGVAVVPHFDLPTGPEKSYLGVGGLGGGGMVAGSYATGPLMFALNAGIDIDPDVGRQGLLGGPHLVGSLAVGLEPIDNWGVVAEVWTSPLLAGGANESPAEFMVTGRRNVGPLQVVGGFSKGVTPSVGASNLRVLFGVTLASETDAPTMDADGDGIVDADDACPSRAETENDYEDADGCPDDLARILVVVADADGKPVSGAEIRVPGLPEAVRTGPDGKTALFELVPMKGTMVEVGHEGMLTASKAVDLIEGAQEIRVVLQYEDKPEPPPVEEPPVDDGADDGSAPTEGDGSGSEEDPAGGVGEDPKPDDASGEPADAPEGTEDASPSEVPAPAEGAAPAEEAPPAEGAAPAEGTPPAEGADPN